MRRLRTEIVVDIGANEGQYGSELREYGYQGKIFSIEPLGKPFGDLFQTAATDGRWECLQAAVGSKPGAHDMNIAKGHKCSSMLRPTDSFARALENAQIVSTERVIVRKLDDLIAEKVKPKENLYLKADVQGFELEVFKGGDATLQRAKAVEVELSLDRCYQDGASAYDVIDHLHRYGLELVNVSRVCDDTGMGRILQLDGIFERLS